MLNYLQNNSRIICVIFSFVADILVGASGHDSGYGSIDYFIIAFTILVNILLVINPYPITGYNTIVRSLNVLLMLLVFSSIVAAVYLLWDSIQPVNPEDGSAVVVIAISIFLLAGAGILSLLIKDRLNKL